ncbi:MAG: glutathione peroxidase [Alphaproteobacteria bacterium]|nr:glutathione peroxidase [Alphaproteobacteria bacterium]
MVRAIALVTALAACLWAQYPGSLHAASPSAHDIAFTSIDGEPLPLSSFAGKAVLVVNTASLCGFTYQYAGLQEVFDRYRDRGLVVLGVPSNDFGQQEPGDAAKIKHFCEVNFDIDFPLTEKQSVKGEAAHPFFRHVAATLGKDSLPRWNFHKYLIDPKGRLVGAWPSKAEPAGAEITGAIEDVLP